MLVQTGLLTKRDILIRLREVRVKNSFRPDAA
jgi:hypothetical protein